MASGKENLQKPPAIQVSCPDCVKEIIFSSNRDTPTNRTLAYGLLLNHVIAFRTHCPDIFFPATQRLDTIIIDSDSLLSCWIYRPPTVGRDRSPEDGLFSLRYDFNPDRLDELVQMNWIFESQQSND